MYGITQNLQQYLVGIQVLIVRLCAIIILVTGRIKSQKHIRMINQLIYLKTESLIAGAAADEGVLYL